MPDDKANSKFTILAADRDSPLPYFDQKAAEIGAKMVYGGATTPEQIEDLTEDVDAVIVFRTFVNETAIKKAKRCKLLLRQGIGFDLIDVPAATRAGIYVSNIPDYCIEEVSDHAMTLLLATVRNLLDYHRVTTEKGWGYFNTTRNIPDLRTMQLGIVGLGKIGRALARKAQVFGVKLAGYDPYVHQDIFDWLGVERIRNLDDLLQTSDIITIHTPLTPETDGMFGEREFGLMKEGSFFINTARGKIVDLTALQKALESKRLAAAGLDVFEEEPMRADHPILQLKNLVATPHVAFYSETALREIVTKAIDEVVRTLRGERPLYLVNPDVYAHRN